VLTIVLPPDARLIVNDEPTPVASGKQAFLAPGLDSGRDYTYTMKATRKRGEKLEAVTRRVTVRAGDRLDVDFRTSFAEAATEHIARSPETTLTVVLPEGARLRIDGQLIEDTSRTQVFAIPFLAEGQEHRYTVSASVRRNGRVASVERRVTVAYGQKARIDLAGAAATLAAK
jgi:uncharacterized protein (TIGR03000 family)